MEDEIVLIIISSQGELNGSFCAAVVRHYSGICAIVMSPLHSDECLCSRKEQIKSLIKPLNDIICHFLTFRPKERPLGDLNLF